MLEQWLTGPRGRGSASPPSDIVQSVSRAMQLMEIIGSEPGLTVKQMARRLDMNRSTVYHLVRTLVYEGYLIRDKLGNYTMGPAVADRYRDLCRALRGADDNTVGVVLQWANGRLEKALGLVASALAAPAASPQRPAVRKEPATVSNSVRERSHSVIRN